MESIFGIDFKYDDFNKNNLQENHKKDEKIKSIMTILKNVLADNFGEILKSIQASAKLYSNQEDISSLLKATTASLRAYIIRKITRDYKTIAVKDIARYLDLK
jgi:hypothetical protein